MDGSMSGMGGGGGLVPLNDSGVDFSNETQAFNFLAAILDDSVLQVYSNMYARIRAAAANHPRPATPKNTLAKSIATVTAIFRESSYPQWTPVRGAFWFKVPTLGTILVLLTYLGFVLALEFINNDIPGAQHYTALGLRAAWLAVAQVPLLILLAGKNNLIGLVTGVSYERLNIFHRWVSRVFLLLATFHFGFQMYGWNQYGLVKLEWATDTCPPTGIAAYSLLLWLNLTTVAPLRHLSYEVFVIQHLITFFGFIIAIMIHIPSTALYARVYIYIPIALYLVDRIIRAVRWAANNVRPGRAALLTFDDGEVTKIRIMNPPIKKWTPGAFVLLSIPRFGFGQSHPATIVSIPTSHNGELVFLLRSHGGFTKRISKSCSAMNVSQDSKDSSTHEEKPSSLSSQSRQKLYRAFIDGPYGASQADFVAFDTVVLIAGSTGISFILPILLDMAHRAAELKQKLPVRRVEVMWMVKGSSCTAWVSEELQGVFEKLRGAGIEINIKVHVTCDERLTDAEDGNRQKEEGCQCQCDKSLGPCCCISPANESDEENEPQTRSPSEGKGKTLVTGTTIIERISRRRVDCATMLSGRPNFHAILWELLDQAEGETGVAVCGPLGLSTAIRFAVAQISDQRAVHKGTGAQGIYLHVEGFCW